MRLKKYCAIAFLTCILNIGACTTAFADIQYYDVDKNTPEGIAITGLTEAGVVGGYEDGSFRPDGYLTRAEFVKIVNRVFLYREKDTDKKPFEDISAHWAEREIEIAQQNGYIGGVGYIKGKGSHCFAPDMTLTREQVAVMLGRILELKNLTGMNPQITDPVSKWAENDVKTAIACGLLPLEKENTFRATEPITRAEVCIALKPYLSYAFFIPEGEQKQIYTSLKEAVKALEMISLPNEDMNRIISLLHKSIQESLNAFENGAEITPDYVKATFPDEIAEIKDLYYGCLSHPEKDILKKEIVNHMSLDAVSVLYDYYLMELV